MHIIPIIGNIRTGSATLKQALSRYLDFKKSNTTNSLSKLSLKDIRDKVKKNLSEFEISDNRQSYNRQEVQQIIQKPLYHQLKNSLPHIYWEMEYKKLSDKFNDSVDIYGKISDTSCVVIEIDTIRSDQICKKFVARQALTENMNCIYVIVTSPNTNSSYQAEKTGLSKFIDYITTLCNLLSQGSRLEKYILTHNI